MSPFAPCNLMCPSCGFAIALYSHYINLASKPGTPAGWIGCKQLLPLCALHCGKIGCKKRTLKNQLHLAFKLPAFYQVGTYVSNYNSSWFSESNLE